MKALRWCKCPDCGLEFCGRLEVGVDGRILRVWPKLGPQVPPPRGNFTSCRCRECSYALEWRVAD